MDTLPSELQDTTPSSVDTGKPRFVDYFPKGSGPALIFREYVVSFLTLEDLHNCSQTCKRMCTLCRTFTLHQILKKHAMEDAVSESIELDLAKFVIGFVKDYRNVDHKQDQDNTSLLDDDESAYTYGDDTPFHSDDDSVESTVYDTLTLKLNDRPEVVRKRRYHPATIPDILFAMTAFFAQRKVPFRNEDVEEYDWEKANSNPITPVLLSATYGKGGPADSVDVTVVLRYLLMREGNRRLILERPSNGPWYWYNYLFGDPAFKNTKVLILWVRLGDGTVDHKGYCEDDSINIPLRAESIPFSAD